MESSKIIRTVKGPLDDYIYTRTGSRSPSPGGGRCTAISLSIPKCETLHEVV
jgi:hypothetical protein